MKRAFEVTIPVLAIALAFSLAGTAWAQEKPAEMPPEQAAMMAEYMKYAQPGEFHAHLKAMEGTWKASSTMWMAPGAEPMASEGDSINTLILGGRYLMQEYSGSMMGDKYHGVAITGYDNYKKKYVSAWIDDMGTMIMLSEGDCDATGKKLTMIAKYDDPVTKTKRTARMVTLIKGPTEHRFEMYDIGPDGKEVKNVAIVYTKQ